MSAFQFWNVFFEIQKNGKQGKPVLARQKPSLHRSCVEFATAPFSKLTGSHRLEIFDFTARWYTSDV